MFFESFEFCEFQDMGEFALPHEGNEPDDGYQSDDGFSEIPFEDPVEDQFEDQFEDPVEDPIEAQILSWFPYIPKEKLEPLFIASDQMTVLKNAKNEHVFIRSGNGKKFKWVIENGMKSVIYITEGPSSMGSSIMAISYDRYRLYDEDIDRVRVLIEQLE